MNSEGVNEYLDHIIQTGGIYTVALFTVRLDPVCPHAVSDVDIGRTVFQKEVFNY
jgi:hypothetical protein